MSQAKAEPWNPGWSSTTDSGDCGRAKDGMSAPIIDHVALNEVYLGDRELLLEIIAVFLKHQAEQTSDVDAAVRGGDAAEIARTAHKLKGALITIGASAAAEQARALERLGHEATEGFGDLSAAGETLASLQSEMGRLLPELARMRAG